MKVKARYSEEELIIYREKTGVLLYSVSMAIICIAFGAFFVNIEKDDLFPLILGGFFIIAGVLILLGLPKYNRSMKDQDGAVLLCANREGLSIAPLLNMTPVKYAWSEISKILLTNKLITKETGEKRYNWNMAIVYFQQDIWNDNLGFLERSKKRILKSPQGNNISTVDIPQVDIEIIQVELCRFASNKCEISSFGSIEFNYVEAIENFQP